MTLFPLNLRRPKPDKHCWGTCNPTCPACCRAIRERATTAAHRSFSLTYYTPKGN